MKPAVIFHLESKNGKFIDSIFSSEDLISSINEDPSNVRNIFCFSKDHFSFPDIQNQLQSISHLINTGFYMIDGSERCNKVDRLLSLQELVNSVERTIKEIKVKLSYQLDLELIYDQEEIVQQ